MEPPTSNDSGGGGRGEEKQVRHQSFSVKSLSKLAEEEKAKLSRQGSFHKGIVSSLFSNSSQVNGSNNNNNHGNQTNNSTIQDEQIVINGHHFLLYNYATPVSCRNCKLSIWHYGHETVKIKQTECEKWSLNKTGYKCKNCSMNLHGACVKEFQLACELGHHLKTVRNVLVKRGRTRSIDDYAQIVRPSAGYILEDGLSGILQGSHEISPPVSLNETPWYSLYFLGREHDHFVMSEKKHKHEELLVVSVIHETPEVFKEQSSDTISLASSHRPNKREGGGHESDSQSEDEDEDEEDEDHEEPRLGRTGSITTSKINPTRRGSHQGSQSPNRTLSSSLIPSIQEAIGGDGSNTSGDEALNEKDRKKKEKKDLKEKKKLEKKIQKEREKEEKKQKKLLKKLKKSKGYTPQEGYQYRVIIWKKTGKEQWTIPVKQDEFLSGVQIIDLVLPHFKGLKLMDKTSPLFHSLSKELVIMEREEFTFEFKFGVLYVKKGQNHEDEFFGNETGSTHLYEFLDSIADKVELKGFQGFAGGLDVENNSNGEYAYATEHDGNDIIFHVSTLLPYAQNDPQQIKRKRHIGNDIVCLVFQDSPGCCFSPRAIKSQMIHTFIAVCLEGVTNGKKRFRVNVTSKDVVPPFGPTLPDPPVFMDQDELREFLLQKLVNAERSALFSESFQTRREKNLAAHLAYINSRYSLESSSKKTVLRQKLGDSKRAPKISIDLSFSSSFSNPQNLSPRGQPFSTPRSARASLGGEKKTFQIDSGLTTLQSNPSLSSSFTQLPSLTQSPFTSTQPSEKTSSSLKSRNSIRRGSLQNINQPPDQDVTYEPPQNIHTVNEESSDNVDPKDEKKNQQSNVNGVNPSTPSRVTGGGRPKLRRRGSAPAIFVSNPTLIEPNVLFQDSNDYALWETITPDMLGIKSKN